MAADPVADQEGAQVCRGGGIDASVTSGGLSPVPSRAFGPASLAYHHVDGTALATASGWCPEDEGTVPVLVNDAARSAETKRQVSVFGGFEVSSAGFVLRQGFRTFHKVVREGFSGFTFGHSLLGATSPTGAEGVQDCIPAVLR